MKILRYKLIYIFLHVCLFLGITAPDEIKAIKEKIKGLEKDNV